MGGIAFLADFSTLALLTSGWGWHYLESAAVAFAIGMAVNYVLSVAGCSRCGSVKNARVEFLLFALSAWSAWE